MKKAIKVTPKKWWSIKAWKSAKLLQEFDNWLVEHPSEIIEKNQSDPWLPIIKSIFRTAQIETAEYVDKIIKKRRDENGED